MSCFAAYYRRKPFGSTGKAFPSRRIARVGVVDDLDAARYIQAGNFTDPTEQSAAALLALRLKQAGIWGKTIAVYPMMGGTSTTCALNLRSSLYTITWVNAPTFAATGVTFNGSNNYGNLNLNPASLSLSVGISGSVYSRTASIATGNAMAGFSTGPSNYSITPRNTTSFSDIGFNGISGATPTNCQGLWSNRKSGALAHRLYRNGVTVATGAANTQAVANLSLFLGAGNNAGTPTNFMNFECAFAHIGTVLDDNENLTLYNIVQEFQTALGRQV